SGDALRRSAGLRRQGRGRPPCRQFVRARRARVADAALGRSRDLQEFLRANALQPLQPVRRGGPRPRSRDRPRKASRACPHPGAPVIERQYRYYEFVMAAFVTVLICSNLIGPAKIAQADLPFIGAVSFGAGVLFFPISYVFGDILTEVYGYAR